MTERQFIQQNKKKWEELESLLKRNHKDADQLNELFVKVSSDLSYARTFFPNRSVRLYLNNLTKRVFDTLGSKKEKLGIKDFIGFFSHSLPIAMFTARKAMLVSFVTFALAVAIGAFSSSHDERFAAIILGDSYIEMTERNINDGDPMAVYKDEAKVDMFLGITINNVRVSFLAFVLGILGGMGTIFLLMYNGIMLGSFQYFFYQKGLFVTSFLTIWIHGTIEISAIIIAGGAGLVLGGGLLFPKTRTRRESLQISALHALKIVVGTVPLFVIAGLLESFVTRQTELPTGVKATIIGLSLLFILVIYVLYPYYYCKKLGFKFSSKDVIRETDISFDYQLQKLRKISDVFSTAFLAYSRSFFVYMKHVFLPIILLSSIIYWLFSNYYFSGGVDIYLDVTNLYSHENGGLLLVLIGLSLGSYAITQIMMISHSLNMSIKSKLLFLKKHFITVFLSLSLLVLPFYFLPTWAIYFTLIINPFFLIFLWEKSIEKRFRFSQIGSAFNFAFSYIGYNLLLVLFLGIAIYLSLLLVETEISNMLVEFLSWHQMIDHYMTNYIWVNHILYSALVLLLLPLCYMLPMYQYHSIMTGLKALDLHLRFKSFGQDVRD